MIAKIKPLLLSVIFGAVFTLATPNAYATNEEAFLCGKLGDYFSGQSNLQNLIRVKINKWNNRPPSTNPAECIAAIAPPLSCACDFVTFIKNEQVADGCPLMTKSALENAVFTLTGVVCVIP